MAGGETLGHGCNYKLFPFCLMSINELKTSVISKKEVVMSVY